MATAMSPFLRRVLIGAILVIVVIVAVGCGLATTPTSTLPATASSTPTSQPTHSPMPTRLPATALMTPTEGETIVDSADLTEAISTQSAATRQAMAISTLAEPIETRQAADDLTLTHPEPERITPTFSIDETPLPTATPMHEILPPPTRFIAPTAEPGSNTGGIEAGEELEDPDPPIEPPTAMPTETPVEVAHVPFVVRDVSGAVIGDGTVRVYAPERVQYPQTVRVELELQIDNRYITPTPRNQPIPRDGQVRATATPRPGRPTPTPPVPLHEESGLEIYQRMGASLRCSERSFDGCDERPNPADARFVNLNGVSWSWIIAPRENIRGLQDLELQIWKLISVNEGAPEPEIVWTHNFRIDIAGAASMNIGTGNPAVMVGIAVLVGLAAVAGVLLFARRGKRIPIPASGSRPSVFISYGRNSTFAEAWFVSQELQKAGADVFIDVEDIHEGRFAEIIEKAIRERVYFVPVLAPDTLNSEWVRKEIVTAMKHQRKIVPVMVRGFSFDSPLPDDVRDLQTFNAVTITPEFMRAGIDKLLTFVDLKRSNGN